jgi:hypothetical protein
MSKNYNTEKAGALLILIGATCLIYSIEAWAFSVSENLGLGITGVIGIIIGMIGIK